MSNAFVQAVMTREGLKFRAVQVAVNHHFSGDPFVKSLVFRDDEPVLFSDFYKANQVVNSYLEGPDESARSAIWQNNFDAEGGWGWVIIEGRSRRLSHQGERFSLAEPASY